MMDRATRHVLVLPLALLGCCLATPIAAEEPSSGEDLEASRRATAKLAAAEAVRSAVRELGQLRLDSLEATWAQSMIEAPAEHADRDRSRKLLAARYREVLLGELGERLNRLHHSFNPPTEGTPRFTRDWLDDFVQQHLKPQLADSLEANAESYLGPIFNQARERAIAEQLRDLGGQISLEEAEADTALRDGLDADERERLIAGLIARASAGKPLLAEVASRLHEVATASVDDAHSQYRAQLEILRIASVEGKASGAIADALAKRLTEVIERRRRTSAGGHPVYGVFPSIHAEVPKRAVELEEERFADYCRRQPTVPTVAELVKLIRSDFRAHRKPGPSHDLLRERLRPAAASTAVDSYTAGEAPDLSARLAELVKRDAGGVREALDEGIAGALAGPLRQAREQLAAEQFARHFPEVASSRWAASENLLLQAHHKRLILASFDDARGFPFLAEGGSPYRRDELLEETEERVFLETAKLTAEGQRAWEGQLALVFEFEDPIAAEIRRSKAERTLEEWQEYFLQAFEKKWGEERFERVWRGFGKGPEHAAGKYAAVFGNMADRIRNEVKHQYELAEKPPQKPTPVIEDHQSGTGRLSVGSDTRVSMTPGPGVPGGGDGKAANDLPVGGGFFCIEAGVFEGILECRPDGYASFAPKSITPPGGSGTGPPLWQTSSQAPEVDPVISLSRSRLMAAPLPLRLAWLAIAAFLGGTIWLLLGYESGQPRVLGGAILAAGLLLAGAFMWMAPTQLEIEVDDLRRASLVLERQLGKPAERLDEATVEFRIGPLKRVLLRKRDASPREPER